MAALEELRNELDEIDAQIIRLYEQRMKVCGEVADFKIQNGRKVYDRTREQQKLAAAAKQVENPEYKKGVQELFALLMSVSRKLQYQKLSENGVLGKLPFIETDRLDTENVRIVFQGVEGAYSQAAMKQYFGEDVRGYHVHTWREAMEAIEDGAADFAVLPIENSSAGAVNEVYDLLVEFENYIVGETVLPVNHVLAGLPGSKEEQIMKVYSHPQGLMQCEKYLYGHAGMEKISVPNTAVAARTVVEENDPTHAAICSAYAAEVYGLEILRERVNDSSCNSTRFIIVTNQKIFCKEARKISICFELPHQSGSLYQMLSHFIYNDLNMTKIESRPVEDRPWEYRFFVDFEGNLADGAVKNAIRGLREEAKSLKILGNY
ncbi:MULTISPECIES: prephenate dehydratase [Sellimonas]|uniref:Bifunctional chorismate mutase/prephenate dehydratase n=1 Tax=Sellimonas caecigallum TaxID=2592333 RepID=A0ABS7L3S1_9FIRM|nr:MULTISPECIES: prephenate dehydratase [Sellimonas]MBY0757593.1 prephenate dehydratase [Sellimonas caecigallum]OUP64993.1 chorismate mutase [Drancourtella sp. An177]